jgi:hypothetical protein
MVLRGGGDGPGDVPGPCPDAGASLSGGQIVVNLVHLHFRWLHAEFPSYWADLVIGEALELLGKTSPVSSRSIVIQTN